MALMMLVGTSSAWAATEACGFVKVHDGVNYNYSAYKMNGACFEVNDSQESIDGKDFGTVGDGFKIYFHVYVDEATAKVPGYVGYMIDNGGAIEADLKKESQTWNANNKTYYRYYAEVVFSNAGSGTHNVQFWVRVPHSDDKWYIKNNSGDNFTFSYTMAEYDPCPEGVTYTVAGNGSGNWCNGKDWSPSAAVNDMDCDNGIYSITYTNVAAGTYKFKVCKNHSWDEAYPSSDYEFNVEGTKNITITFNAQTKGVNVVQSDACIKPTKSDYILQSSVEYGNGAPSITPKQGFPVPTTIKYGTTLANATTTAPTAVGTYNVYITTEATNTYCAVSNLDLGTYTITCKTPTTALDLSKEDIVKCGDDVLVPGTITVNNYSAYNSENVFYLDNTEYTYTTIGDNGGKIGGINTSKEYTVSVAKKCGTSYSEKKSTNITIVSSDVKKTPTLASTPIVKCGTSYNPGELKITNYDANYNYTINPTVDAPTINGNIATYVINGNSEIEYTVTATHKTYNTCSSPVTQKVTITDNSATIAAETDINQNFCTGDVITLTVTAGQGTYNWVSTNGGQVISQKTNSVTVTQSGTYTVTATNASGCVSNEVVFSVTDSGVMIHASGETTLGANKFAALYVTDCSGREIETYQWEYCSPESSKYVNYTASVSNSGTLYSGDAGTTNNIRPSDAGFYRCTVTYKGGGTATSAAKEVTGTYSYLESNIPVIVVNTNGVGFPDCPSTGGTASKNADVLKEKRSVDVKIYDGTTLVYDRKARMNYRGSSSLNFQKKSYAFCPGKDNCVEDKGRQDYVKTEKMNMLGVGSAVDKDWVLYASAADPTLMRNRLVFDTYKAMRPDDWSVQSRYVELIVDGEHKGVYVLMDKITKNDNRVKLNEENGFIVKFDKTDCADRFGGYNNIWGDEKTFITTYTGHDYVSTYDTHIDQRFEIEYPEKDDYTIGWSSKVKSIQAMFQAFEDALKAGEYATVQKYIDYDSWADWFIINEYTKNVDAYRASCIFVYTGEEGAKIEARPLWDQELSFNNQCPNYMSDYGSDDATGFLIQENKVYEKTEKHIAAPFWFTGGGTDITGGLLSDPCFVQIVKEKWSKYSTGSGPLTENVLNAKIATYTTELGAAKNREAEYWKTHSRSTLSCSWDNHTTGYNDNIAVSTSQSNMETWFAHRGTNLTKAIDGLTGSSFSIEIMPYTQNVTPWETAKVAIIVKPEGYDYKLEYIGENDLSSVANAIIEQEGDNITYRIPRPTEWGTGDAAEGERSNVVYNIKAILNVQEGTNVCGTQSAPTSIATITLEDEGNDNCPQP